MSPLSDPEWIGGAIAALGVAFTIGKRVWKRTSSFVRKTDATYDVLVGRPAILHPDTGEQLAPATPGLGVRLSHMEEAIVGLAQVHGEVGQLSRKVDSLATKLDAHIVAHDGASSPAVTVVNNSGDQLPTV